VYFETPETTRDRDWNANTDGGFSFPLLADIRLQLNEQLRCLDVRMEAQVALVAELQDFFRKRAELELDYSKSLDKMARSIQLRHKEQKQKYDKYYQSISSTSISNCTFHILRRRKFGLKRRNAQITGKCSWDIQFYYLRDIDGRRCVW